MDTQNSVLENEARVNITWKGANGDLVSPVLFDSRDEDIRGWVQEAVRTGTVPGIPQDEGADFSDFVVDRFGPSEVRPHNALFLRPKTPFGST